jgi:hypothetical protein
VNQYDDLIEAAETGWGAPQPVQVLAVGADQLVISTEVRLCGWSLRETSAAAVAALRLRNGDSVGGPLVASIALASGGSDTVWLGDKGIRCGSGVFLDWLAGVFEGAIWLRFPE